LCWVLLMMCHCRCHQSRCFSGVNGLLLIAVVRY
jgi:hypothetical protein